MALHTDIRKEYHMEYSVYFNQIIFVHNFFVTPSMRGMGYSRVAFDRLKNHGLPIALEADPSMVKFYEGLGFTKSCTGREGYAEMNYQAAEKPGEGD